MGGAVVEGLLLEPQGINCPAGAPAADEAATEVSCRTSPLPEAPGWISLRPLHMLPLTLQLTAPVRHWRAQLVAPPHRVPVVAVAPTLRVLQMQPELGSKVNGTRPAAAVVQASAPGAVGDKKGIGGPREQSGKSQPVLVA